MSNSSRLALLVAVAGLTACSGGTPATTAANASAVQIATLPSGEHVVRFGSHTFRYGGPRHVSARHGWISPNASRRHLLYGSSYDGDFIEIYNEAGNDQSPIGLLSSDLTSPQGVFVDPTHQLWVANTNAFNVVAFKRGKTTPFTTLNDPGYYPITVAVDGNGTVYAANAQGESGQPGSVTYWTKGSTNPSGTLTYSDFNVVIGVGVDASNNVYVSYVPKSGAPAVVEFPAGSSSGSPLAISSPGLGDITFDSSDNLVMETLDDTLGIWAPPYTGSPGRTISVFGNEPTLNKKDSKVWIAYANSSNPMIEGYDYATGQLVDTITNGFTNTGIPYGVAVDPRIHP